MDLGGHVGLGFAEVSGKKQLGEYQVAVLFAEEWCRITSVCAGGVRNAHCV